MNAATSLTAPARGALVATGSEGDRDRDRPGRDDGRGSGQDGRRQRPRVRWWPDRRAEHRRRTAVAQRPARGGLMLVRIWAKGHDLLLVFYGTWLAVLTVLEFGWPWQWV